MSAAMEFGVSLPGRGPLATPDSILKISTKADALGYDSLFVTDHVVLPASMATSVYPYSATGHLPGGAAQDYLEPLAVLAWLAHVTRRIRIGTSVLVVPYRNPVVTAKTLATIDRLSNGRVILGAGVGWLREEFAALAAPPFEARGAVTDDYLRLMRAAWTTERTTRCATCTRCPSRCSVAASRSGSAATPTPPSSVRRRWATPGIRSRCGRRACSCPTSTRRA
jgi:alkanesulfonate monooxygenase SsuD/methylene tetrahydromethanopterin reductase-like flavin-dependent oxidoreductase (luciferase family)